MRLLARLLYVQGKINLEEAFVDATFASVEKGALRSAPRAGARAPRSWLSPLPLAVSAASASPAECKLVEEGLAGSFLDELPERLIGDKAYDSDKLDQQLKNEYGIEMIAPNRRNRGITQDRRKLRH